MTEQKYLDQRCTICGNKPVRYVKAKGGFLKVCNLCAGVLEMAGLLVEPDRIHAMKLDLAVEEKSPPITLESVLDCVDETYHRNVSEENWHSRVRDNLQEKFGYRG